MEEAKKQTVLKLYEELANGNTHKVSGLFGPDIDWWFHGPPGREHMMHVLTGLEAEYKPGLPNRVAVVGMWVVAEGWVHKDEGFYWVHVWAVEGGVITKLREYFNTRVTVREIRPAKKPILSSVGPAVWESRPQLGRSMPGLVLAI